MKPPETVLPVLRRIDLINLAFSINQAGGGGNLRELYNPNREGDIVGLTEELGPRAIPFFSIEQLPPSSTVCCVARLGKPGAKADRYASEAALSIIQGLEALAEKTKMPFPSAIFPVEATAGQMARAIRSLLAANNANYNIGLLDGDVCGGMAVPAVPLAFNIFEALKQFPQIALIQLKSKGNKIIPSVQIIKEDDPFNLETKLREMAASSEMGAVWFAWFMCKASDFSQYFTPGAVTSSITRGKLVRDAIENGQNPAEVLLSNGEITRIIGQGIVEEVIEESHLAPGFAQFSYTINLNSGERLILAARNEFIALYTSNRVIAKAPYIISVIGPNGPIQSHVLKPNGEVVIVEAIPHALRIHPSKKREWEKVWQNYWRNEINEGRWPHPY